MYSAIETLEKAGVLDRFCIDHNLNLYFIFEPPHNIYKIGLERPGDPTPREVWKCFAGEQIIGPSADPERLLQQLIAMAAEFDD